MDPVTVAWWRNVAGLLLMFEFFVLCLSILIVFFFAVRGMQALRAKLEEVFPLIRDRTVRAEEMTHLVSKTLVTPPIRVRSAVKGAASGAQMLITGKRSGG